MGQQKWLNNSDIDSVPFNERVKNEFPARINWNLVKLMNEHERRIERGIVVTRENCDRKRLTTPLAFFKVGLLSVEPLDSVDYPLCFDTESIFLLGCDGYNKILAEDGILDTIELENGGDLIIFESPQCFKVCRNIFILYNSLFSTTCKNEREKKALRSRDQ